MPDWQVCGWARLWCGQFVVGPICSSDFFEKKNKNHPKKMLRKTEKLLRKTENSCALYFHLKILKISEFLMRKIFTLYFSRFQISEFPHPPFVLPTLSSHLDPFGIKSCLIFMGHSEKLQPTRRMNGKGPHRPSALRKGTSSSSKKSAVEVVKPNLKKKEDRTEKEKEKKAKSQQEEKKREDAKKVKENEKALAKIAKSKQEEEKGEDAKKPKRNEKIDREEESRSDKKRRKDDRIEFVPCRAPDIAPIFTPPSKKMLAEAKLAELADSLNLDSLESNDDTESGSENELEQGEMDRVSLKGTSEAEAEDEEGEDEGSKTDKESCQDEESGSDDDDEDADHEDQNTQDDDSSSTMDLDEEDEDDQDFEEDVPEDIDPSSEEEQEEKPKNECHALVPVAADTASQVVAQKTSALVN